VLWFIACLGAVTNLASAVKLAPDIIPKIRCYTMSCQFDPQKKIWGLNNRLLLALINAAVISFIEIFLAKTPAFVWVYPWWGAVPVFITVYIPFFLAAFYCYDWKPETQKRFLVTLALINAAALVVFAGVLKWI
jgi:hypothetical protein